MYRWTYLESNYYNILAKELGLTKEELLRIRNNDKTIWGCDEFVKERRKMKSKANSKLQWKCLGRWRDEVPNMTEITIDPNSHELTDVEEKILKMDIVQWFLEDVAEARAKKFGTVPGDEMKKLLKEKAKKVKEVAASLVFGLKEAEELVLEKYYEKANEHNTKEFKSSIITRLFLFEIHFSPIMKQLALYKSRSDTRVLFNKD